MRRRPPPPRPTDPSHQHRRLRMRPPRFYRSTQRLPRRWSVCVVDQHPPRPYRSAWRNRQGVGRVLAAGDQSAVQGGRQLLKRRAARVRRLIAHRQSISPLGVYRPGALAVTVGAAVPALRIVCAAVVEMPIWKTCCSEARKSWSGSRLIQRPSAEGRATRPQESGRLKWGLQKPVGGPGCVVRAAGDEIPDSVRRPARVLCLGLLGVSTESACAGQ